ncbi:hypothetical protein GGX14DRAFT_572189 [Mycena pura]|uniref:Uncharacterized protein n=1 Tax=Mycena pura TaxID=153505 RepID=A0AAD6V949_9AGAR|nr:hypothetical protein GGX14DRAFT_572189 [Mycena pura]
MSLPSLSRTQNALTKSERSRLVRSNRKLQALLGEAPQVIGAAVAEAVLPRRGVAPDDDDEYIESGSLPASPLSFSSTSTRSAHLDASVPSPPLTPATLSPTNLGLDNVSCAPSTKETRRRHAAKLTRTLGENITPDLISLPVPPHSVSESISTPAPVYLSPSHARTGPGLRRASSTLALAGATLARVARPSASSASARSVLPENDRDVAARLGPPRRPVPMPTGKPLGRSMSSRAPASTPPSPQRAHRRSDSLGQPTRRRGRDSRDSLAFASRSLPVRAAAAAEDDCAEVEWSGKWNWLRALKVFSASARSVVVSEDDVAARPPRRPVPTGRPLGRSMSSRAPASTTPSPQRVHRRSDSLGQLTRHRDSRDSLFASLPVRAIAAAEDDCAEVEWSGKWNWLRALKVL